MLIELNKVESKMICEALEGYLETLCREIKEYTGVASVKMQCLKVFAAEELLCFFRREMEKEVAP